MDERIEGLRRLAEWLENDCGDCETCSRTFSLSDHEHLRNTLATLTQEERDAVFSFRNGGN